MRSLSALCQSCPAVCAFFRFCMYSWSWKIKLLAVVVDDVLMSMYQTECTLAIFFKCHYDQKIISFFPSDFESVFAKHLLAKFSVLSFIQRLFISSVSLLYMQNTGLKVWKSKTPVLHINCDNTFLGRVRLLSLLQQSEGNTLAATEFIRPLEVPGSITAKQSTGTRENTQILGSNSRV